MVSPTTGVLLFFKKLWSNSLKTEIVLWYLQWHQEKILWDCLFNVGRVLCWEAWLFQETIALRSKLPFHCSVKEKTDVIIIIIISIFIFYTFKYKWHKSSQVWILGVCVGEKLFNGSLELDKMRLLSKLSGLRTVVSYQFHIKVTVWLSLKLSKCTLFMLD